MSNLLGADRRSPFLVSSWSSSVSHRPRCRAGLVLCSHHLAVSPCHGPSSSTCLSVSVPILKPRELVWGTLTSFFPPLASSVSRPCTRCHLQNAAGSTFQNVGSAVGSPSCLHPKNFLIMLPLWMTSVSIWNKPGTPLSIS